MAFHNFDTPESYVAGADFTGKQYTFVKINTGTDSTVVPAGAGERADGVIFNEPIVGHAATVVIDRKTMVFAGGTFADGDELAVDANGRAVLATAGAVIVAVALGGAVVDQLTSVKLRTDGAVAA